MSGVQVSECGPGGRRVSVVQATLVARRAVWTASSFTVRGAIEREADDGRVASRHPGRDGCEERAVAGVAAADVLRLQRQGHGRAPAARERRARRGGGREQAASENAEETRSV